jgi:hypothetical protein
MNLFDELQALDIDSEDLDNIVVDIALDIASQTNNGGIEEQVDFLRILGGFSDEEILAMVEEAIEGQRDEDHPWNEEHLDEDPEFGDQE